MGTRLAQGRSDFRSLAGGVPSRWGLSPDTGWGWGTWSSICRATHLLFLLTRRHVKRTTEQEYISIPSPQETQLCLRLSAHGGASLPSPTKATADLQCRPYLKRGNKFLGPPHVGVPRFTPSPSVVAGSSDRPARPSGSGRRTRDWLSQASGVQDSARCFWTPFRGPSIGKQSPALIFCAFWFWLTTLSPFPHPASFPHTPGRESPFESSVAASATSRRLCWTGLQFIKLLPIRIGLLALINCLLLIAPSRRTSCSFTTSNHDIHWRSQQ